MDKTNKTERQSHVDEFYILFGKKIRGHANVFTHTYAYMKCWIVFNVYEESIK